MKKVPVMLFLAAIIILGVVYIYLRLNDNEIEIFQPRTGQANEQEQTDSQGSETQTGSSTTSGGGGSSGGSSGGSGAGAGAGSAGSASGSTTPQCLNQQISHSLKQFQKSQVCNELQGEICIDKTVSCSVEVKNLDDSTSGQFTIQFNFFEVGFENIIISSVEDSNTLSPGVSEIFSGIINLQGADANKVMSCNFDVTQVPEEEVCR